MNKPVEHSVGRPEPQLSSARVAVIGGGPIVPVLCSTLARGGVAEILLVRDMLLTEVDVQHSRLLRKTDAGRRTSDIVRELLVGTATRLEVVAERPESKLDWQAALRGVTFAVVPILGPVLFHPAVDTFNEATQDAGVPWIGVALLDGKELHVGPTIVPGVTACWKCFELRYKSNLSLLEAYLPFEKMAQSLTETRDLGLLPPIVDIAAGLAATEVLRFHTPGERPASVGKLLTFDVASFALETHPVLRLPRCAVCTPAGNAPSARAWGQ